MTEVPDASMLQAMVRDMKGCSHCRDLTDVVVKQNDRHRRLHRAMHNIIADMKSNHDTHKNYIKRLEQVLEDEN